MTENTSPRERELALTFSSARKLHRYKAAEAGVPASATGNSGWRPRRSRSRSPVTIDAIAERRLKKVPDEERRSPSSGEARHRAHEETKGRRREDDPTRTGRDQRECLS